MSTFALDLTRFAEKAEGNAEKVVRKIGIDLFSRTVERTPVGNPENWASPAPAGYVGGRARANWNCSIGAASFKVTDETDKSGNATQAKIRNTLHDWKQGDIYLMNSLPYIRRLEYDGWSGQAPQGMVRITVTEFQTFVDAAARSVNP
ncbi:HK97 gp10 family phage protein [Pseudoxanthomonas sacheonensis]|uniref:HK97 gp10 family phage protein n=1 Tax=Pseudoxanthomonas sacheonensis TaxID=443615 RepID=UPI0013D3587A|nr:HK97 gp10 family phage protein [Pseudoxanthomonas sacheonensis]KAF1706288.1 hypothetical protein CSC73_16420 [Pseudoxanthomonas sacheonensis]